MSTMNYQTLQLGDFAVEPDLSRVSLGDADAALLQEAERERQMGANQSEDQESLHLEERVQTPEIPIDSASNAPEIQTEDKTPSHDMNLLPSAYATTPKQSIPARVTLTKHIPLVIPSSIPSSSASSSKPITPCIPYSVVSFHRKGSDASTESPLPITAPPSLQMPTSPRRRDSIPSILHRDDPSRLSDTLREVTATGTLREVTPSGTLREVTATGTLKSKEVVAPTPVALASPTPAYTMTPKKRTTVLSHNVFLNSRLPLPSDSEDTSGKPSVASAALDAISPLRPRDPATAPSGEPAGSAPSGEPVVAAPATESATVEEASGVLAFDFAERPKRRVPRALQQRFARYGAAPREKAGFVPLQDNHRASLERDCDAFLDSAEPQLPEEDLSMSLPAVCRPAQPTEPAESVEPAQPSEPVEPVQSMEPVEPEQPVEPVEPVGPVQPNEPIESVEPVEPEQPMEPMEPVEPVEPVEPEQPTEQLAEPAEYAEQPAEEYSEQPMRPLENMEQPAEEYAEHPMEEPAPQTPFSEEPAPQPTQPASLTAAEPTARQDTLSQLSSAISRYGRVSDASEASARPSLAPSFDLQQESEALRRIRQRVQGLARPPHPAPVASIAQPTTLTTTPTLTTTARVADTAEGNGVVGLGAEGADFSVTVAQRIGSEERRYTLSDLIAERTRAAHEGKEKYKVKFKVLEGQFEALSEEKAEEAVWGDA